MPDPTLHRLFDPAQTAAPEIERRVRASRHDAGGQLPEPEPRQREPGMAVAAIAAAALIGATTAALILRACATLAAKVWP